jgi:hypothetical protein
MAFKRIELKLANMSKPQEFSVQLANTDHFYLQSDKAIAKVNQDGIGIVNPKGSYFHHLSMVDDLYPVHLNSLQMIQLNNLFVLKGDTIGASAQTGRVIYSGMTVVGFDRNNPTAQLQEDFDLAVSHFMASYRKPNAESFQVGKTAFYQIDDKWYKGHINNLGKTKAGVVLIGAGFRDAAIRDLRPYHPLEQVAMAQIEAAKLYELPNQIIWISPKYANVGKVGLPYRLPEDGKLYRFFEIDESTLEGSLQVITEDGCNYEFTALGQAWNVTYENGVMTKVELG